MSNTQNKDVYGFTGRIQHLNNNEKLGEIKDLYSRTIQILGEISALLSIFFSR
jgi:hypothetical protein